MSSSSAQSCRPDGGADPAERFRARARADAARDMVNCMDPTNGLPADWAAPEASAASHASGYGVDWQINVTLFPVGGASSSPFPASAATTVVARASTMAMV
jgi:hypothetical protein